MINKQKLFYVTIGIIFLYLAQKGHLMAKDNIETYTLSNGLTVILVNDPSSSLASIRTYVKAGSIFEGDHCGSGLSHYLEHLVAGGSTSKRSEDDYKTKIALLGGAYNAYTTTDHTSYFINTTNTHIPEAITILYEWMFYNSFKESEVAREKEVITREIEKTSASVSRQFYYLSQNNFYITHPIKFPVIGYLSNFLSVSKETLMSYYYSHYVPSNMILVVGGSFDIDAIKNTIANSFGQETRKAEPIHPYLEEQKPFTTRLLADKSAVNVSHVSFRFSTTHLYSKDLYSLDLLDYILGNGEESILYKKLVEEKKLAYDINTSSYTPISTTGYFDITAEIELDRYDDFKSELLTILDSIKKGSISEDHIKRAKKQKIAEDVLSVSTIEDKVARYGQGYLFGQNTDFFEIYSENFKKITKKDLESTAKKYFTTDTLVSTLLYPETETMPIKAPITNQSTSQDTQLFTLKNGVRVLINSNPNDDKSFAQILIQGGLRYEEDSTNGIGYLISDCLGKESKMYSKEKLNKLFEDEGAHVGASVGNNVLYYSLECLQEDFNALFPIFEESFLNATFSEESINESKRIQIANIKQRHDDWHKSAQYQFKQHFYQTHPYHLSTGGEIESLTALNSETVSTYFQSIKNPQDMILSFYGNVDPKAIIAHLEKTVAKLPQEQRIEPTLTRTLHTEASEHSFSVKQDVTAIYYGFDGVTFLDTDTLLKLDLLDSVLSGMQYPSGRLHNLLREAGYVYMVYGSNQPGIERGHFQITALINDKHLEEAQKLIESQIQDLKTNLISDEEFELAKEQMKFYYQDRLSSLESKALIQSVDELYNRGFNYSNTLLNKIDTLTKEDVYTMANRYLIHPQIYVFRKQ